MPKGSTSKETVGTMSYSKKLFFMVKFPEFLGSPTYSIQFKDKLKSRRQFTLCYPIKGKILCTNFQPIPLLVDTLLTLIYTLLKKCFWLFIMPPVDRLSVRYMGICLALTLQYVTEMCIQYANRQLISNLFCNSRNINLTVFTMTKDFGC